MLSEQNAERCQPRGYRQKLWVAFSSLLAAFGLTTAKLGVGPWTNSLGLLSEAAHSGLDLMAAAMTLWAVHIASRPADSRHTYGHEKVENLSALFQTLLLLGTCGWIVYEGLGRLFSAQPPEVQANLWAFLVVILSIGVDWSRSRALAQTAQKYQSQALEADALHFSTDIFSSLVVLFGLVGVAAADRGGPAWLLKADALAALVVALVVVGLCLQLGKKAVEELLDTIPLGLQAQVRQALHQVPGVAEVDQVRIRRSGAKTFADLTIRIRPMMSLEQSHQLAHQAEEAVHRLLPGADVVVHVEPLTPTQEDVVGTVRAVAGRHGLAAHAIRLIDQNGQHALEFHLEVPPELTLQEAHGQATACEDELHQLLPNLQRIVSHLEPTAEDTAQSLPHRVQEDHLFQTLQKFLETVIPQTHVHDLQVVRTAQEVSVSFHCTLPGQIAISQAHHLAEQVEKYLRTLLPAIGRIVIHVEPEETEGPPPPPLGCKPPSRP